MAATTSRAWRASIAPLCPPPSPPAHLALIRSGNGCPDALRIACIAKPATLNGTYTCPMLNGRTYETLNLKAMINISYCADFKNHQKS